MMKLIKNKIPKIFWILCLFSSSVLYGQNRISDISNRLDSLHVLVPDLSERVDISVDDVSIQDFCRAIADNSGVNIDVSRNIHVRISNNFTDVSVHNILLYLCKNYSLDITVTGSILSIVEYAPPVIPELPYVKKINIVYEQRDGTLSMDLRKDSLYAVCRKISEVSNTNIVLAPDVTDRRVRGYYKNIALQTCIEQFAYSNSLEVEFENNIYTISNRIVRKANVAATRMAGNSTHSKEDFLRQVEDMEGMFNFHAENKFDISVEAFEFPIYHLLKIISDTLNENYFFLNELEGTINLNVANISYEELLKRVLNGTEYTYNKEGPIYIIGTSANSALLNFSIVPLRYRRVDHIIDFIPADIKKSLEIIEFPELNSLLVSGSLSCIEKLKNFTNSVDKVVPVILIEIMILDINKGHTISTGINMGTGEAPATAQTILPGIDYSLSTETINNVLNKISGTGWANLGSVSSDFYITLKAMEDNNMLKIHSTPKLSTMNGHEATMRSGETKYYKEEQNNFIGSQNPALTNSYQWKAINADLTVSIKPFVSGEEQVIMEISVVQSEFTARESEDAPPGSVTRDFKSMIRVQDGETILLGGLDRNVQQSTGKGIPFLARIPIIKWFFSSKTKHKSESTLNILIKPSIIY